MQGEEQPATYAEIIIENAIIDAVVENVTESAESGNTTTVQEAGEQCAPGGTIIQQVDCIVEQLNTVRAQIAGPHQ